MSYTTPQVVDFKNQFVRDFPYGADSTTSILDADIVNAINFAGMNFNEGLWSNQQTFTIGYLLLAAHYLVMNIRASSQGISGQFNFLQAGKNAGSVSETFAIPERIQQNPEFAMLCKTNYGAMYLQMILPQLAGQIYSITGATQP